MRRIAEKDEFTASLWKRVLLHIQLGEGVCVREREREREIV